MTEPEEYLLKRGWVEQPPYHKDAGMWYNAEVDTISFPLEEAYRIEQNWQEDLSKHPPDNIKLCPKCGRTWDDS